MVAVPSNARLLWFDLFGVEGASLSASWAIEPVISVRCCEPVTQQESVWKY